MWTWITENWPTIFGGLVILRAVVRVLIANAFEPDPNDPYHL